MARDEDRIILDVDRETRRRLTVLAHDHRQYWIDRHVGDPLVATRRYHPVEADYVACLALYAAATYYGAPFSWHTVPTEDDAFGLLLPQGHQVQVKATEHPGGNVIIPQGRTIKLPYILSCVVTLPSTVTLVGWCTRPELYAFSEERELGYGPTTWLSSLKLRSPHSLPEGETLPVGYVWADEGLALEPETCVACDEPIALNSYSMCSYHLARSDADAIQRAHAAGREVRTSPRPTRPVLVTRGIRRVELAEGGA